MDIFILAYLVLGIIALANSHKKLDKNSKTMLIISLSIAFVGSFISLRYNNIDFVLILLLGGLTLAIIALIKSADKFVGSGKILMIIGCSMFLLGIITKDYGYNSSYSRINSTRNSFESAKQDFEDISRDFQDAQDDFDNYSDSFNEQEEQNYDNKKINETIKNVVKKINDRSFNSLWNYQELPIEESFSNFKKITQEIRSKKGRINNFEINSKVYQNKNGLEKLKVSVSLNHSSGKKSKLIINLLLEEISNRYSIINLQFI